MFSLIYFVFCGILLIWVGLKQKKNKPDSKWKWWFYGGIGFLVLDLVLGLINLPESHAPLPPGQFAVSLMTFAFAGTGLMCFGIGLILRRKMPNSNWRGVLIAGAVWLIAAVLIATKVIPIEAVLRYFNLLR